MICYLATLLHFFFDQLRPPFGALWRSDVLVTWRDPAQLVRQAPRKTSQLVNLSFDSETCCFRQEPLQVSFLDLSSKDKLQQWHELWLALPTETHEQFRRALHALADQEIYQDDSPNSNFWELTSDATQDAEACLGQLSLDSQRCLMVRQGLREVSYGQLYENLTGLSDAGDLRAGLCVFFREALLLADRRVNFSSWSFAAASLSLANSCAQLEAQEEAQSSQEQISAASQALEGWKRRCLQQVQEEHLGLVLLHSWPAQDTAPFYELARYLRRRSEVFWILQFVPSTLLLQDFRSVPSLGERLQQLKDWSRGLAHAYLLEDPSFWPQLRVAHVTYLGRRSCPLSLAPVMNRCFASGLCSLSVAAPKVRPETIVTFATSSTAEARRDLRGYVNLESLVDPAKDAQMAISDLTQTLTSGSFYARCLFSGARGWETRVLPALERLREHLEKHGGELLLV
jgi:hypothetical protein